MGIDPLNPIKQSVESVDGQVSSVQFSSVTKAQGQQSEGLKRASDISRDRARVLYLFCALHAVLQCMYVISSLPLHLQPLQHG